MSKLKECLNGAMFYWDGFPAEVYRYDDGVLYRYNHLFKEWVLKCGPNKCKQGCPIHEDGEDKEYHTFDNLEDHLKMIYEMNKTREVRNSKGEI